MKGLPSTPFHFAQDRLLVNVYNKKEERKAPLFVRMKGLEPPRLTAPDPKSGAAANYATSALFNLEGKYSLFINTYTLFFSKKKDSFFFYLKVGKNLYISLLYKNL